MAFDLILRPQPSVFGIKMTVFGIYVGENTLAEHYWGAEIAHEHYWGKVTKNKPYWRGEISYEK